MRRKLDTITEIVIHCSASANGQRVAIETIDSWHRSRGFRRSVAAIDADPRHLTSIGYHRIIQPNGLDEVGRNADEVGAHAPRPADLDGLGPEAADYPGNSRSLGVCLIGTDRYTMTQWFALRDIVGQWMGDYPIKRVWSHNQLTATKTCPGFLARDWAAGGMQPIMACLL